MKDEIIEEVWKIKDAISAEHQYDVKRLVEALRSKESASGTRVVDLRAVRLESTTREP
jgi:hypothetical protein